MQVSAHRFLWSLLRRYPGLVLFGLGCTMAAALFEGSTIGILALALESLSAGASAEATATFGRLSGIVQPARETLGADLFFLVLISLAVVSQIARSGLEFGGKLLGFRLLTRVEGEIQAELFRRFMARPFEEMQRHKLGDLSSYIEQTLYVGQTVQRLTIVINQLLLLAVYVAALLWLSWPMTLVALVAGGLLSAGLRRIIQRVREIGGQHKEAAVNLTERTVEYLGGLRLVRTFAQERFAVEQIDEAIWRNARARLRGLSWQSIVAPVVDCATVIAVAAFLAAGYLLMASQGVTALPRLATFLFVLYRLAPRIRVVHDNYAFLTNYSAFLERIAGMLHEEEPPRQPEARPYEG
ncbi:MAG: ABC transporter ATP-binding protein, partial [Thermoanaerobaculia bacterium]|nr:ABC transporter ATP-binding protein [Thermoanaerobaculia bacterium]